MEQESSAGLKSLQRGINGCLSALSVYEISTRDWNPILVFLCMQRLPKHTITLWEQSIRDKTAISLWNDLDSFLSERIQTLDCLRGIMSTTSTKQGEKKVKTHFSNAESSSKPSASSSDNRTGASRQNANVCVLCPNHAHSLRSCFRFKKLSVSERFTQVKLHRCCINCLSRSHEAKEQAASAIVQYVVKDITRRFIRTLPSALNAQTPSHLHLRYNSLIRSMPRGDDRPSTSSGATTSSRLL